MRRSYPAAGLILAAGLSVFPISAQAASLVLGSGLARSCYEAAERGATDAGTVRLCSRALDEEPLSPRDKAATFVNRGVLQLRRQAFGSAVADFDRAIALTPGSGEAWANRGSAKVGMGQYADALGDLDRGLALGAREQEKAWYNKALAYEALGDTKNAYVAYQRASALAPSWDLPKRQLARFTVSRRGG